MWAQAQLYARMNVPESTLQEFCQRWQIAEPALFGSILEEDCGPHSEMTLLLRFMAKSRHSLIDMTEMEDELVELSARNVRPITRAGI